MSIFAYEQVIVVCHESKTSVAVCFFYLVSKIYFSIIEQFDIISVWECIFQININSA